jgi:outer membrane protein assembly factor BamB
MWTYEWNYRWQFDRAHRGSLARIQLMRPVFWSVQLPGAPTGMLTAPGASSAALTWIFVSGSEFVYALDSANGTVHWKYATASNATLTPPALNSGALYVVDANGTIHALNSTTDSMLWKVSLATMQFSSAPAFGKDGTIYFAALRPGKKFVSSPREMGGVLTHLFETRNHLSGGPLTCGRVNYVETASSGRHCLL